MWWCSPRWAEDGHFSLSPFPPNLALTVSHLTSVVGWMLWQVEPAQGARTWTVPHGPFEPPPLSIIMDNETLGRHDITAAVAAPGGGEEEGCRGWPDNRQRTTWWQAGIAQHDSGMWINSAAVPCVSISWRCLSGLDRGPSSIGHLGLAFLFFIWINSGGHALHNYLCKSGSTQMLKQRWAWYCLPMLTYFFPPLKTVTVLVNP
jgi:hypothetical protein